MKINTKKHNFEEMYQVGNVIQWINGNIYLVVDHGELDYSLVDLTNNKVYATYDTLENLISNLASESDVLVNAEINVFWGGINMKINFKNKKSEDMYKVGNVIKDIADTLYLVVGNNDHGYALVNLTDNNVTEKFSTLEGLANVYGDKDDVLVKAEINVF